MITAIEYIKYLRCIILLVSAGIDRTNLGILPRLLRGRNIHGDGTALAIDVNTDKMAIDTIERIFI